MKGFCCLLILIQIIVNEGTVLSGIDGFGNYPLWRFNKYSGLVLRPVPLGLDIGMGIPPPPPMPPLYPSSGYQNPPVRQPSSQNYAPPQSSPYTSPPQPYSGQSSPPASYSGQSSNPYTQLSYESQPYQPAINISYSSYPSGYGAAPADSPAYPAVNPTPDQSAPPAQGSYAPPSYSAQSYTPGYTAPGSPTYSQDTYSGQPPYVPTVNIAFSSETPSYGSYGQQSPPAYTAPPAYEQPAAPPTYTPHHTTYSAPHSYEQPAAPPAYPSSSYTPPTSYSTPPQAPTYSAPPQTPYSSPPSGYDQAAYNPASSVSYTISNGQPTYDQNYGGYNGGSYTSGGYEAPPSTSYGTSYGEPTSYMSKRASAPAEEAPNGIQMAETNQKQPKTERETKHKS